MGLVTMHSFFIKVLKESLSKPFNHSTSRRLWHMGAGSPKAEFHPNLWWDCITPYQSRVRGNPLAHHCRMDGVWTTKHFVFCFGSIPVPYVGNTHLGICTKKTITRINHAHCLLHFDDSSKRCCCCVLLLML